MTSARLPEGTLERPRILWMHQGAGDAQRYRCIHAQEQLALYGIHSTLRHYMTVRREDTDVDIAILHRIPFDRRVGEIIERIHKNGGIVIFDTDDLVFTVAMAPQLRALYGENPIRLSLYRDEVRRYRTTLCRCDAALVSTQYLAHEVSSLGVPAWRHANAFSLMMFAISEGARKAAAHNSGRLVIGYASGTPTHSRDFQQAKPALQQILAVHPQVELWIVGHLDPGTDWGQSADRGQAPPVRALAEAPLSPGPVRHQHRPSGYC